MTTDTKELRRLAEKATPGKWKLLQVGDGPTAFAPVNEDNMSLLTVVHEGRGRTAFAALYSDNDAQFIVAANPAAILALLASHERQTQHLATLREALTKANEDINWMLNAREFLNAFVFDYIEKALAATAPAAREGEAG